MTAQATTILNVQLLLRNHLARRATSNIVWNCVGRAAGRAGFVVANIVLARRLGVEQYGKFVLAQMIAFFIWSFAVDFGTEMYGSREVAKHKRRPNKIINPLLTIRLLAGFLAFSLYAILVSILPIAPHDRWIFIGCGVYLITNALNSDWIPRGLESFAYVACGNTMSSLVFLIATFCAVRSAANAPVAAFIWSASYVPGALLLLTLTTRKHNLRLRLNFSVLRWSFHLKQSIFFTFSAGMTLLYSYLPLLLLNVFRGPRELGLVSALYKLITNIGTAGLLLAMACYPIFAQTFQEERAQFHRIHRALTLVLLVLGMLIAIPGCACAGTIIPLIFGEEYRCASGLFAVVIWAVPLQFLRFAYGPALLATGFQRYHNLAALGGVIGSALLAFALIPSSGALGAAWTVSLGELVMAGGMLLLARRAFRNSLSAAPSGRCRRLLEPGSL